ncbi:MAG: type 4a pilus biogenesis protein PilO [Thermodesulfovibrionales bacterium]
MAAKIDMKTLPAAVKAIFAVLPSIILIAVVLFVFILPKQKEIKKVEADIDKQNNEIAVSEAKVAKLEVLKLENERLAARLNELKEQLPEEKEISSLLKQVSDLGIGSGLVIKSWKPSPKVAHASGIVEEIPVAVDVAGTYHNLGNFLSSLTRLNRIVNVTEMRLGSPKAEKGESVLSVSFRASTFSAVPEADASKAAEAKK